MFKDMILERTVYPPKHPLSLQQPYVYRRGFLTHSQVSSPKSLVKIPSEHYIAFLSTMPTDASTTAQHGDL